MLLEIIFKDDGSLSVSGYAARFWFQKETREIEAKFILLGSQKKEDFLLVLHRSKRTKN
jgi:hypothetical protein